MSVTWSIMWVVVYIIPNTYKETISSLFSEMSLAELSWVDLSGSLTIINEFEISYFVLWTNKEWVAAGSRTDVDSSSTIKHPAKIQTSLINVVFSESLAICQILH